MLFGEYNYETDIRVQRREAFEDGVAEGIEQGIEQGAEQKAIETASEALKMNLSIEQIAKLTGLSEEKILQLSKEISNQ